MVYSMVEVLGLWTKARIVGPIAGGQKARLADFLVSGVGFGPVVDQQALCCTSTNCTARQESRCHQLVGEVSQLGKTYAFARIGGEIEVISHENGQNIAIRRRGCSAGIDRSVSTRTRQWVVVRGGGLSQFCV
jgi:hypothetical protein